jgi:tRNA 5-methylaminomethyl-2-thiouridine biosynthesis bifunctional protein
LIASLATNWPLPLAGFHRIEIAEDIVLTLLFGESVECLVECEFAAGVDAVFLDGFAPERNPAMWSPELLRTLTRACRAGATLATWCVAGSVRRGLQDLHWQLDRRPGFAGKREMLVGRYAPPAYAAREVRHSKQIAVSPAPTFASGRTEAHALVIGAGLAGALCAERLAARGWQVTLCERAAAPGAGASGIPSALLRPRLALDDALATRLARLAFSYSARLLLRLQDLDWRPIGVLHLALDAEDAAYQRACCERHQLPAEFAAYLSAEQISERFGSQGIDAPHGGWWFACGGVMVPSALCQAALDDAGPRLSLRYQTDIRRLEFADGRWYALDASGGVRASATHVIITTGAASHALLPAAARDHLPLDLIRGQLSEFTVASAVTVQPLQIALCGDGHLAPPFSGRVHVGASFVRGAEGLTPGREEHAANLEKLQRLHPLSAATARGDPHHDWVGQRAMTPDRLPYAGAVPDCSAAVGRGDPGFRHLPRVPGLHLLGGLGARGLLWAPLLAEHLVSQLVGDPLPLPHRLAAAVDPGRYYLRKLRKRDA